MSPIPQPKPPPHGGYELAGPFRMFRGGHDPVNMEGLEFDQAVAEFVRYCCPPSALVSATAVMDIDGVVGIGWYQETGGFKWVGTLRGYEELRRHEIVDPLVLLDAEKGVAS